MEKRRKDEERNNAKYVKINNLISSSQQFSADILKIIVPKAANALPFKQPKISIAYLQIQSDITLSIQLIKRQQEPVPRPACFWSLTGPPSHQM